jgi:group I intron endonuclease
LKYGYSRFKLEVLEYCVKSNLIKREQHYISLLKPEYNVLTIAGSNLGFKHSEATKELFRSSRLGGKRENILVPKSSGSSDAELISSGNKKRVFSEATKLKLSANNYKSIAVILSKNGRGIIYRFPSKNKAAQFLGVSETTVRNYIKQQRTCKGYTISIV